MAGAAADGAATAEAGPGEAATGATVGEPEFCALRQPARVRVSEMTRAIRWREAWSCNFTGKGALYLPNEQILA